MHLKRAFYLGLIGSLGGLAIILIAMTPIGSIIDMRLYSHAMGISAGFFSLLALFGCFLIKKQREIAACFLMLISAVGGIISMSLYYVIPGFLLILAGILAIMNKNEQTQEAE